jgi:hypothetical protein
MQASTQGLEYNRSLLLDSGVLGSNVVQESQLIFKAIEKSGLHGGKNDKSRVVRHRQIHDPGIQQEPAAKSIPLRRSRNSGGGSFRR